jgi:hypothetical protein
MEPRELVGNLDNVVQLIIRKFYSKSKGKAQEKDR